MRQAGFVATRALLIAAMVAVTGGSACGEGESAGVRNVDPQEAYRILSEDPEAVLVDVRSRAEFAFVGHPTMAYNVPLLFWNPASGAFEPNPRFGEEIAARFGKEQPILLICRSGGRSANAGGMLVSLGFEHVYNVVEGVEGSTDKEGHRTVNGWKNRGLPYGYTVDDARRYRPSP
jgi:rhodanese-related sulfurtransferase